MADVQDILTFDILSQERLAKEIIDDILAGETVNYQSRFDFAEAAAHGLMNCRKTGILHIDVFISPMLKPEKQTASGYLMRISDITLQKIAEENLAFQARLLESVDEAVVATDMHDRITYWGKGAEKMFGNSAREMLGRPVGDLFFSKGLFENMVVQKEETAAAEYAKPQPDGSMLWLSASVSLIRNSGGNLEGIVGILRDITGRKQAEDALKDREKQLEMMFQKLIMVQEEERKRLARELLEHHGT